MTKEEKIKNIEMWVKNYNDAHKLTDDIENAGHADFYTFNSTDVVNMSNAYSNESETEEDWGFEPNTDYYELEMYKYRKVTNEEIASYIENNNLSVVDVEKMHDGKWYTLKHEKQYLSKDFNYFYNQVAKVFGQCEK